MKITRKSSAFTLIELLVVITIIAILASMVFTGLGRTRTRANQTASLNNLRQWGVAFSASLTDFDNRLPTTGMAGETVDFTDKNAWFNRVPQYINELPLSDPAIAERVPKRGQKSLWVNPATPGELVDKHMHPPTQWLFSYAMNGWLSNAAEPTLSRTRIDSTATTVLMGEQGDDKSELRAESVRAYFGGTTDALNDKGNYAHFLFVDGRVELIRRDVFDPRFNTSTTSPIDSETIAPGFSYVPFKGATLD